MTNASRLEGVAGVGPSSRQSPDGLYYFAYGSNLLGARLRARVPSARFESTAALAGYRMVFNKRGADGSAKCNMMPALESDAVHGVIWRLEAAEKASLDAVEGPAYYCWWHSLRAAGRVYPAFSYVVRPGMTTDDRKPYDWYRAFVIAGAEEHDLPPEYRDALYAVSDCPDPDADRAERNRLILRQSMDRADPPAG